jgi:predicted ATPase
MTLKIRVQNVASFQDSEQFEIKPGLNVFIGINNSGKTALLWAIAMLGCAMKAEKSAWALALPDKLEGYRRQLGNPAVQIEYTLPKDDRDRIISELCKLGGNQASVPYAEAQETIEFNIRFNRNRQITFVEPVRTHFNDPLTGRRSLNLLNKISGSPTYTIKHPFGGAEPNTWQPVRFDLEQRGIEDGAEHFRFLEPEKGVAMCWPPFLNSVFVLGANREFSPRYSTRVGSTDLKPNAENLTQVLRTANQTTRNFRDSRRAFQRIEEDLRSVFPEVRELRAEGIEDPGREEDQSEIVLDLKDGPTVSLSNSGSGMAQIATVLTAAHLKTSSSLFLLDEPHAYLHAAAERALVHILETLAKERGHIFCLATHSTIISNRCKNSLFAVVKRKGDSKVVSLKNATEILTILGITNFDLFTHDKVLFVEGPSDVRVFGLVLDAFDGSRLTERVKLVELSGDGKLKSKAAHDFKRLLIDASAAKARVPVGFLLDSGGRTNQEKIDLHKVLHKPPHSILQLLKRDELEDYLLDPASVAAVLGRECELRNIEEDPQLEEKINKIVGETDRKGSATLQRCFEVGIAGRAYRKREDSPLLAEEILATNPTFLEPLYKELQSTLDLIGIEESTAADVM